MFFEQINLPRNLNRIRFLANLTRSAVPGQPSPSDDLFIQTGRQKETLFQFQHEFYRSAGRS